MTTRLRAHYIGPISGPALPPETRSLASDATRAIAIAWNSLQEQRLIDRLANEIRYDSQSALEPLIGKAPVGAYLRARFARLRALGRSPAVELGEIDLPEAQSHPCAIGWDGSRPDCLFVPRHVSADGRIGEILILTIAPHPSEARGTREFPGLERRSV